MSQTLPTPTDLQRQDALNRRAFLAASAHGFGGIALGSLLARDSGAAAPVLAKPHVAAKAIGKEDRYGSIKTGMQANFAELSADDVDHWMYHFRPGTCEATWINGRCVFRAG